MKRSGIVYRLLWGAVLLVNGLVSGCGAAVSPAAAPRPTASPAPTTTLPTRNSLTFTSASQPETISQPVPTTPAPAFPPASWSALDDGPVVRGGIALSSAVMGLIVPTVDPAIVALLNDVAAANLQATVQTLTQFGTRHALSETDSETRGIGAARRWLLAEFERVGRGRIQVSTQDFTLDPALSNGYALPQQNILAILPGTNDETGVLVLMAHYDSRPSHLYDGLSDAPGADDDASGVAILLEVARLMSNRTWEQTIYFIVFAAEELETQGSRAFIAYALSQGLTIECAINNDMVGGYAAIPAAVRVFSAGPDSSSSRQLARTLHHINQLYFPDFTVLLPNAPDRPDGYGDQREFYAVDIPAIRLTEVDEDSTIRHTLRDSADRLNDAYLAQITRLNIAVLANLAVTSPPHAAPTITFLALPDVYRLTWGEGIAAAGYVLAFRPPDSLTYTLTYYMAGTPFSYMALPGLDPQASYAYSLAIVDAAGHLSRFSPELLLLAPSD